MPLARVNAAYKVRRQILSQQRFEDLSSMIIDILCITPLLLVAAMQPWRTSGTRPCGWLHNWILDLSSIIIDILFIAPLLLVAAMQPWRTSGVRPRGWLPNWILDLSSIIIDILCIGPFS
jgi:hypothetical protein